MATTRIRAESFPDLADEVLYPRIAPHKMEWLGERRSFAAGEVLYEQGMREGPFFVVESGRVDLIDRKPGKEVWIAEVDGGTFLRDVATFTGEPAMAEAIASEPTETIAFDRAGLSAILAASPEMGELVPGCLLARRAWHEGAGHGVLRLIAERGSRRAFDVRDLLERDLVPLHVHDVGVAPLADRILEWLDIPREETPILVRNDRVLRNPSAAQVARELGLRAEVDGQRFDLVVLGGGPAGLAAAVYGGSEGLRTLVAEAWGPGGQAGTSNCIENYLGFPTGISGADLTRAATLQARRFDAVIYRDEDVLVVGGGNSAAHHQDATHLARHARSVRMAVRGPALSSTMSRYLVDRIERSPRIEVLTRTEVAAVHGARTLEAVTLRDGDGREERIALRAVFVMIGAEPCTEPAEGVLGLDAAATCSAARAPPAATPACAGRWPTARPTCSRPSGPGSSRPATRAPARPTGWPAPWATARWPCASSTLSWTAEDVTEAVRRLLPKNDQARPRLRSNHLDRVTERHAPAAPVPDAPENLVERRPRGLLDQPFQEVLL